MTIQSSRRRGRPCVKRDCICGSRAIYAVQASIRTIGPGQSLSNRHIRLGLPTYLCAECVRKAARPPAFFSQLEESVQSGIDRVMSGERRPKPLDIEPLF